MTAAGQIAGNYSGDFQIGCDPVSVIVHACVFTKGGCNCCDDKITPRRKE